MLTEHIINEDERLKIASRAPTDVFVPTLDPGQRVSTFTGNFWPFRTARYSEVHGTPSDIEQTLNRSLEFRLLDDRLPGHNFPADLVSLASRIPLDAIRPIVYANSRDSPGHPAQTHQYHDHQNSPRFIVPVIEPYGLTISALKNSLLSDEHRRAEAGGIANRAHPTDFALVDCCTKSTSLDGLVAAVERFSSTVGDGYDLHLEGVYPSVELARYIREHPNRISSVELATDLPELIESSSNTNSDYLSTPGETDLRTTLAPEVELAGIFALLTSDYIEDEDFAAVARDSLVPSVPPSTSLIDGYRDLQQTTPESADPQHRPASGAAHGDGNLSWYTDSTPADSPTPEAR